jgi:hypothetical protein
MTMTMEHDLRDMARLAGAAADMAAVGQRTTMAVLLAEMQALASLMPGMPGAGVSDRTEDMEARHRAEEAEVEAAFDNMPV